MKRGILRRLALGVWLVGVTLLLVGVPMQSSAQSYCTGAYCGSSGTTLFGQAQAYDVLLRGNGVAVVSARLGFTNDTDTPLKTLDYTLEKGSLIDAQAYQEIDCSLLPTLRQPAASDRSSLPATDTPACYPSLLKAQQDIAQPSDTPLSIEPDGTTATTTPLIYYVPSGAIYKKLRPAKTETSIRLDLSVPVAADKQGTVLLFYQLGGIAKRQQGAFRYEFKSLKSSYRASDVTVAVSTDEAYVLADAVKSKVNYAPTATSGLAARLDIAEASAADIASTKSFVGSIGTNGWLTRHASSLAPGETFTVTGRYASNSFLLHWQRTVMIWGSIIVALIGAAWWGFRRYRRLTVKVEQDVPVETKEGSKSVLSDAESSTVAAPVPWGRRRVDVTALPFYSVWRIVHTRFAERGVRSFLVGWLCALGAIGVIALAVSVSSYISSHLLYYSTSFNLLITAYYVTVVAAAVLGCLVLLVGLPILYAATFKQAVVIAIHAFLFLVAVAVVSGFLALRLDSEPTGPDYCQGYGASSICATSGNKLD